MNRFPDRRLDDDEEDDEQQNQPQGGPPSSSYFERKQMEARQLYLFGPVTDKMAKECAARVLMMDEMDAEKPITVFINSPGGSADSGFAIYDVLRFVRPPVLTVVNGLCASAGILIQLATDKGKRYSLPGSRFMIHQPSTMGRGTASDLDITAKEVLKLRQRYMEVICEASGQTAEKVLEDARRDFWLSPTEAKDYGIIDAVIEARTELPLD